jgi:diguanylate cyclase (GGDEF)-like protein
MVGRFGGEEFLVILPDTDVAGGEQVAEKMRRVVHELEFSAAGSFFGVTMTFGVSELDPEDRPDQAIRRADEALYAGKQAGRDRVMVWDQIAKET